MQRIIYNENEQSIRKLGITIPYERDWLDKYLILTASVSSLFKYSKSFDLSKAANHLLEHLFGLIRTLCKGDDSQEKFLSSILKTFQIKFIQEQLGIHINISKRVSPDSGAKVASSDKDPCIVRPFGFYINWALQYLDFIHINNNVDSDKFPILNQLKYELIVLQLYDPIDSIELIKSKFNWLENEEVLPTTAAQLNINTISAANT